MDEQATELYVWVLLLLAPICLVLLRGLDRSVFRTSTKPHEPPLWGGAHIAALVLFWFAANIFVDGLLRSVAPELRTPEHQCLVLTGVLLIVLLLAGSYFRVSGQPVATLGFRSTHGLNFLVLPLFYVLSVIVLQPINWGWEVLLEAFGASVEEQDVLLEFRAAVEAGESRQQILFAITAVVLAPGTEEILFRGVFFGGLVERWGFLPAAVLSSLVFGWVHFSLAAFFPLFLVGLVLCYLYRKTGSIYPPMIYHAIFNGVTLLVVFLVPESAG